MVEWECTSVGQSVLIGIAGSEDVVLNVEKKGNAGSQETVEYVDYVNKHTPDSSNHLVLGEGEELVPVDITVPQTAVLGSDGFYHLGTADGPILYMDLIGAGVDMAGFYYSGMPAIHLRGQLFDADGNRIAAYNFLNSFKAYIDDSDDNGIYPMTEDLAIFMKAYGGVNGWFNPMFSPFAAVQDGCDADSAWLVACSYIPSGEVTPPDTNPTLSDYIVAGNSGLCGSEWDPADDNNRMLDNGDGTFTITYNNIPAGTYEFKIAKGSWDENWGAGGANGGNVSITLDSVGSVTIVFNPTTGEISVNNQQAVPPVATGDANMDGMFFAMILAAMGVVAVVCCKKKFF